MIRHIFRLIWNRKRSNFLLVAEIAASLLVVFTVTAFALTMKQNAKNPKGFETENIWWVSLTPDEQGREEEAHREQAQRLLIELRSFSEIQAADFLSYMPYENSNWNWGFRTDDYTANIEMSRVGLDVRRILNLDLAAGRWFEAGDDNLAFNPVVINQTLAEKAYQDQDPLGQRLGNEDDFLDDQPARVVGVVSDYRKSGEFSPPTDSLFLYRSSQTLEKNMNTIALRVAPGTTTRLENDLIERLRSVAPGWSFDVFQLEDQQQEYRRGKLVNLILAGLVAGFLILMVALGLLGVLWQNVTQRTAEIGLRRALGATAGEIAEQILGEVVAVTAIGLLIGTAIVLQLPFSDWFEGLTTATVQTALSLSAVLLLLLAMASALYPSWLATRVEPVDALHYE